MNQPIAPYLTVNGASAAIAYYRKVFGAIEAMRLPTEDGSRIMHAAVTINGGVVMLCDAVPGEAAFPAATPDRPSPVSVAIEFGTPEEVDATFQRAVAANAKQLMKPEDTFWGARFAMLDDPFGHRWMLTAPLKSKK